MAKSFEDINTSLNAFAKTKFSAELKVEVPDLRKKASIDRPYRTALSKALVSGTRKAETALNDGLRANMSASIWAWPRPTIRVSGGTAGSPRDIIDTGRLASGNYVRASYTTRGANLTVGNNTAYAGLVHFGGYIRPYGNQFARTVFVPGRPWLSATVGADTSVSGAVVVDWREIIRQELVEQMQSAT